MRPEIAQSWHRSALAGVDPASSHGLTHREVDRRSRLVRAATPVLDSIAEHLAGTTFSVVLADREARIVDRRFGERHLADRFDDVGISTGRQFLEETTGTNAIATVYETRHGIAVLGEEHYSQALKGFSCYGHPILDPVTGRLDGILDITCPAEQATPLLAPFLTRSVRDIERLLLDGARAAQRRLMAAFQTAGVGRDRPVVVLGEDLVLANPAAMEGLDAADHAALRCLAADLPRTGRIHRLTLSSGRTCTVRIEPVQGTGGAMFAFGPAPQRRVVPRGATEQTAARLERRLGEHRADRDRVLVTGESGTGRTSTGRRLAGDEPVAVLDAADLDRTGPGAWQARLTELLADHGGLVLVEGLHLLPAATAVHATRALAGARAWVSATSGPVGSLAGEQAALAACFPHRVELPPLRARRDELPALVRGLLGRLDPTGAARCTPGALQALATHDWPGNLHELGRAVGELLNRRSAGDITADDIPDAYRGRAGSRRLGTIQQLEHDAITEALRACAGNKVHAAQRLGMSRSTLYRRLRTLGIDDRACSAPAGTS